MVGTAVLRIVVSSDSMKKATAMSQGRSRREDSARLAGDGAECGASMGLVVPTLAGEGGGMFWLRSLDGRRRAKVSESVESAAFAAQIFCNLERR